jgi:hypothetical protein
MGDGLCTCLGYLDGWCNCTSGNEGGGEGGDITEQERWSVDEEENDEDDDEIDINRNPFADGSDSDKGLSMHACVATSAAQFRD